MSAHPVSPELVGRSAEHGHLAGAFDNAPATVPVGGEAGVGKSRPRLFEGVLSLPGRLSELSLGGVHEVTQMRSVVDPRVVIVDGDAYAFRRAVA
jgi:hypothetical protein